MDFYDALMFLGVEEGADAKAIRRAYLRKLRDYKPDQDPEGFQQLRAAYETAQAGTSAPIPEEADPVAEPEQDPLAPYLERLEQGPPTSGALSLAEYRVAVAREALREHPEVEDAYLLLAATLNESGQADEAVKTLRRGFEAGHEGCLQGLAMGFPDRVSDQEWQAWQKNAEATQRLRVADGWFHSGELDSAMALVRDVLMESRVDEPYEVMLLLTSFVLELHALNQPKMAREVSSGIDAMLEHGADPELMEQLSVRMILSQELNDLPVRFPATLRRAMARAILHDRMEDAGDAVHEYAMAYPSVAPEVADSLEATPNLHHFYHHLLSGPESTGYSPQVIAIPVMGIVMLMALLFSNLGRSYEPSIHALSEAVERREKFIRSTPIGRANAEMLEVCDRIAPELKACEDVAMLKISLSSSRCRGGLGQISELAAKASALESQTPVGQELEPETQLQATQDLESQKDEARRKEVDRHRLLQIIEIAERAWSEQCLTKAQLPSYWPLTAEAPTLVRVCAAPSSWQEMSFCMMTRDVATDLEARRCERALVDLNQLNHRFVTRDDPEDPIYGAVAELYSASEVRCGDGG